VGNSEFSGSSGDRAREPESRVSPSLENAFASVGEHDVACRLVGHGDDLVPAGLQQHLSLQHYRQPGSRDSQAAGDLRLDLVASQHRCSQIPLCGRQHRTWDADLQQRGEAAAIEA